MRRVWGSSQALFFCSAVFCCFASVFTRLRFPPLLVLFWTLAWPLHSAALMRDGHWVAGIGDPSVIGWLTVLMYAFSALLCATAAWRSSALPPSQRFWLVLVVLLLALGVNKQLDLQSWLTAYGRDLALAQGWYARRQWVQLVFIVTIGLLALVGLLWLRHGLADLWRRHRLACWGLVTLLCFVLMRAASFHHIDLLLHLHWGPVSGNGLLENTGLVLIAAGAVQVHTRSRVPVASR